MIPKKISLDATGLRVIPERAKEVFIEFHALHQGEDTGPLFFDGRPLEGRWFSKKEAVAMARMVGAKFLGVKEKNQCDGCLAGISVDENGNHRMGGKNGYSNLQSCEKQKYNKFRK